MPAGASDLSDTAGIVSVTAACLCGLSTPGCVLPKLSAAAISCHMRLHRVCPGCYTDLHCRAGFSGPSINPRIQLTQQRKRSSFLFIRYDYKRWFLYIYLRLCLINTARINTAEANGVPPGRAAAGAPRSVQPRRQVALLSLVRAGRQPGSGTRRCAAAAAVAHLGATPAKSKLCVRKNRFFFHAPSFHYCITRSILPGPTLKQYNPLFHPVITFSLRANPARSTITEDSKNTLICKAWLPSGCRIQWIHTQWPHPSQRPLPWWLPVYIARKCKECKVHAWDNIKIHCHCSISPSRSITATAEPLQSLPWRCAHRPWWNSFKPLLNASAALEETVFILPCQF